jgi:Protein of unknown function (DUF1569)
MPERRRLAFASLDDVISDVDRLMPGYEKAGDWSLGQVGFHLAKALTMTVDGRPTRRSWLVRWIIGPLARRHVFRTGTLPTGIKIPSPKLAPPPDANDRAEVEALRAAVRLFLAEPGPFAATHPMFGPMSVEDWRRFHCIHCAHHLSFLVPRTMASG